MVKKEPKVKTNFVGVVGFEDIIKPKKVKKKVNNHKNSVYDRINKMVK